MTLFQWNKFVPVFIVTILIFTDGAIGNDSDYTLCTSSICKQTGEEIINSIDNTVDPCTDFYQHACGGWILKHPVSNSESSSSQFTLTEHKVELQLKALLAHEDANDIGAIRKAKDFYKSCMDLAAIDNKGIQPFLTILTANGDWPLTVPLDQWNPLSLTWHQIHENFVNLTAISGLFNLFVGVDPSYTRRYIITLFPQETPEEREYRISARLKRDVSSENKAYKKYVSNVALIFSLGRAANVPLTNMAADIEALLEFEAELKSVADTPADDGFVYGPNFRVTTINEAQCIWNIAVNNKPEYKINWLETINRRFEGTGIVINGNEKLQIVPRDYLKRLALLISKTPIRTIVNYIHWYAIEKLLKHGNSIMRAMAFQYISDKEGIKEQPKRWTMCSAHHIMPHALSFMYVKRYVPAWSLESVSEMIKQLHEAAKQKIDSSSWVDENAKILAKEKVDAMANRIGYPSWYNIPGKVDKYYSKLTVNSDYLNNVLASNRFESKKNLLKLRKLANVSSEWSLPAIAVNGGYSDSSNSINFPAALLQMPIYHHEKPAALRFGGLGAIIGHEISHGFDNTGRRTDKDGNVRQWWSNTTIDEYIKKVKCFIDQYDKYEITKSSITNERINVDGFTTLDENLGDNAGFSISFKALQQYKSLPLSDSVKIPALLNYSDEKLYFYGVANSLCEVVRPAILEHNYPRMWYSPNKVRVNGVLSNMEDFANAFACPTGSKMNPKNKCVLWD